MTTTASATVTPAQMVFCGEHHQAFFIEIKVAPRNILVHVFPIMLRMFTNASTANASLVP
jgi:hypothetical protein